MIEQVVPRKRAFSRMDPRPQGVYEQVLLANPDQLLLVFACAQPEPHLRMLDRFLVIAEQQGIPPIIIANKCDLIARAEANDLFGLYGPIGYKVIYTSAKTGEGINEVKGILQGKISALSGPSGVGKSSLATRIQPDLKLHSEKISGATGKGRHTTEVRELYQFDRWRLSGRHARIESPCALGYSTRGIGRLFSGNETINQELANIVTALTGPNRVVLSEKPWKMEGSIRKDTSPIYRCDSVLQICNIL